MKKKMERWMKNENSIEEGVRISVRYVFYEKPLTNVYTVHPKDDEDSLMAKEAPDGNKYPLIFLSKIEAYFFFRIVNNSHLGWRDDVDPEVKFIQEFDPQAGCYVVECDGYDITSRIELMELAAEMREVTFGGGDDNEIPIVDM